MISTGPTKLLCIWLYLDKTFSTKILIKTCTCQYFHLEGERLQRSYPQPVGILHDTVKLLLNYQNAIKYGQYFVSFSNFQGLEGGTLNEKNISALKCKSVIDRDNFIKNGMVENVQTSNLSPKTHYATFFTKHKALDTRYSGFSSRGQLETIMMVSKHFQNFFA